MSQFDDELRDVLRGHAERVAAPVDPMPGIQQRARTIQRRRRATRAAGTALSVLTIAVALPVLVHRDGGGTDDPAGALRAPSPPLTSDAGVQLGDTIDRKAARSEPAQRAPAEPFSMPRVPLALTGYLDWPTRGAQGPAGLVHDCVRRLAAALEVSTDRLISHPLWTGRLPDGQDWLYAVEGWSATSTRAQLVVCRRAATAGTVEAVFHTVLRATHPGLNQSQGGSQPTGAGRDDVATKSAGAPSGYPVALVAVAVDPQWALVLGSPAATVIGYAPPGAAAFAPQRLTDGAAVIRRAVPSATPPATTAAATAPAPELFQAVDRSGKVLTPPDAAAALRASRTGTPPLQGWGLDPAA